jgi:tellurite resistance-related uncharacterized protein
MAGTNALPDGLLLARATPEFDERSVPSGLLAAHRIAAGVWGLLVVRSGALRFVFEGGADEGRILAAGDTQTIPPDVSHHVELVGPVRFVVEFHRGADENLGTVST